jgi:hypothetical protein
MPLHLQPLSAKHAMLAQKQHNAIDEHFAASSRREDSCIGLGVIEDKRNDGKEEHNQGHGRVGSQPTVLPRPLPSMRREILSNAKSGPRMHDEQCISQPRDVDDEWPEEADEVEGVMKADKSELEQEPLEPGLVPLAESADELGTTPNSVNELLSTLSKGAGRERQSSDLERRAFAASTDVASSTGRSTRTKHNDEEKDENSDQMTARPESMAVKSSLKMPNKDPLMHIEVLHTEEGDSIRLENSESQCKQDAMHTPLALSEVMYLDTEHVPSDSSTDSATNHFESGDSIPDVTKRRDTLSFDKTVYESDQISEQCHVHVDGALKSAMSVVKNILLQELMDCISPYVTDASDETTNSSSGSAANSSISTGVSSAIQSQKSSKRKRSREGGRDPDDENGDESDDDDPPRKKSDDDFFSRPPPPRMKLKCPFYQRQPEKYRYDSRAGACRNPGFADIAKLKDHIKRVHTRSQVQCPRCWVGFTSVEARDKHLQAEARCEYVPEPQDDQIRPEFLKERLNFKKKPYSDAQSNEEKWKLMFKAIFGEQCNIPSPCRTSLSSTRLISQLTRSDEQHGIDPQLEQVIYQTLQKILTREFSNLIEPFRTNIKGRLPVIIDDCREEIRKHSSSFNSEIKSMPSAGVSHDISNQSGRRSSIRRDRPRNEPAQLASLDSTLDIPPIPLERDTYKQTQFDPLPQPADFSNRGTLPSQQQFCTVDVGGHNWIQTPDHYSLYHNLEAWNQLQGNKINTLEHRPTSYVRPESQAETSAPVAEFSLNYGAYSRDSIFEPRGMEGSLSHQGPFSLAEYSQSNWPVHGSGLAHVNTTQKDMDNAGVASNMAHGSLAELDLDYFTNDFDVSAGTDWSSL